MIQDLYDEEFIYGENDAPEDFDEGDFWVDNRCQCSNCMDCLGLSWSEFM